MGDVSYRRWNEASRWIYSDEVVHPPIIDALTFERTQQVITSRRRLTGPRQRYRTRHVYALRGRLICGVCDRKMQGHWTNDMATADVGSHPNVH